jgi:hypothetical protein
VRVDRAIRNRHAPAPRRVDELIAADHTAGASQKHREQPNSCAVRSTTTRSSKFRSVQIHFAVAESDHAPSAEADADWAQPRRSRAG